jgi:endonuclease YncB( thermonuclease family)
VTRQQGDRSGLRSEPTTLAGVPPDDVAGVLSLALVVGADNVYAGTVTTVRDGDTVHVSVMDALLSVPVVLAVRVAGVNAPELSEPGGKEVRDLLAAELPPGTVVTLRRLHPDKYAGRVDATITTQAGLDVAFWLLDHGFAVAWSGVGIRPRVPWPPPEGFSRW